MSNIDKYKGDLARLIFTGLSMQHELTLRNKHHKEDLTVEEQELLGTLNGNLDRDYQDWYTTSYAVIKQILPDRLIEFEQLYKGDGKRKAITPATYCIQDWLNGIRLEDDVWGTPSSTDFAAMTMRFNTQLLILKSLKSRFDTSLFEITQLVQADLFDSELDGARELMKHKFLRSAGVISGVVLEKHLSQVAANHNAKMKEKNPTISDFNDLLKSEGIIDVPSWRQIQRLGDIRNLCGHNKNKEPTKEDVEDLVEGVAKFTKTLF